MKASVFAKIYDCKAFERMRYDLEAAGFKIIDPDDLHLTISHYGYVDARTEQDLRARFWKVVETCPQIIIEVDRFAIESDLSGMVAFGHIADPGPLKKLHDDLRDGLPSTLAIEHQDSFSPRIVLGNFSGEPMEIPKLRPIRMAIPIPKICLRIDDEEEWAAIGIH